MMIRRAATYLLVAALGLAAPAAAQTSLTLTEAISRARARNPDAGSAAAAEREAAQRVTQARAAYWPKVDVTESWQRGNQPVFVFSSLLAQRQFTSADFALGALNHPDALSNFRSAITVEQSLFDRTNPGFLWFTLFVEVNLFQSSFTQWCPMMTILRKAGVRG